MRDGFSLLRRLACSLPVLLFLFAGAAQAQQTADPTAMTDHPCPPQQANSGADAFAQRMVEPGAGFTAPPAPASPEQGVIDNAMRHASDWPGLCRYRDANAALASRPDVVFIGDSITELWAAGDPAFFNTRIVNRGIGGQTSAQILLRFYADVIRLHPRVVHILAGTNDIAGNTGPTSLEDYQNNIMAMVELARAHDIKVILGAVPPANGFWWAPTRRPAAQIRAVNDWLKSYAASSGAIYADYYAALADAQGGLPSALANDGVHPNRTGYAVMRRVAEAALRAAD